MYMHMIYYIYLSDILIYIFILYYNLQWDTRVIHINGPHWLCHVKCTVGITLSTWQYNYQVPAQKINGLKSVWKPLISVYIRPPLNIHCGERRPPPQLTISFMDASITNIFPYDRRNSTELFWILKDTDAFLVVFLKGMGFEDTFYIHTKRYFKIHLMLELLYLISHQLYISI